MLAGEQTVYQELKSWLSANGAGFNADVGFTEVSSGSNIIATNKLSTDSTIVSCPFSLIITVKCARDAVVSLLEFSDVPKWSERQWISTYIALHWILQGRDDIARSQLGKLRHMAYLNTLPTPDKLRTPLHFSDRELELFKGSNLYGASVDRKRDWQSEWDACRHTLAKSNLTWAELFTWEMYLTAATYLSSRAFPSSLLSPTPTLTHSPSTTPVLIPGVDSLNHARGVPVSWVVTYPNSSASTTSNVQQEALVSLVSHTPAVKGQEIFNNYGPKPNAELILGYGFSLENNIDDTIVLKFGGPQGKKWEIGRNILGAEDIWREILSKFREPEQDATYEDVLDAAGAFQDMIQGLIDKMPEEDEEDPDQASSVRPEIATMLRHYTEGQNDILAKLMAYAKAREEEGIEMARQEGVDLIMEDS